MEPDMFSLHITCLRVDGDQVVLWGQRDPTTVSMIESNLPHHIKQFPHVVPSDTNGIRLGMKCFASNVDGKYYRVRVTAVHSNYVQVETIDYGHELYVEPYGLRIPSYADPFTEMAPEAHSYYAFELQTSYQLSKADIEILEKSVLRSTLTVKIITVIKDRNIKFASFFKGNYNIRDTWLNSGLLQKIPFQLQEAKIRNSVMQLASRAHTPYNAQSLPDTSLPPPVAATSTRSEEDLLENPNLIRALAEKIKGHMGLAAPSHDLPCYPPPGVLSQGTTYNVYVTDCSDPWSFSIQLASDEPLLAKVADDMQKTDKVYLKPPIFPGKSCLGFYSVRNLYARGIVVKVGGHGVSVTFVDYGGTEDLNLREVFEMPTYGFQVKTLSQQFCLAQLPQLKGSNEEIAEIKQCFAEIVANKSLLLKVTPTEENCMQNCELYDALTNTNVKKGMNQKIKKMKKVYVADAPPKPNVIFNAFVTHVESLSNFYVQNRAREAEINKLLEELQVVALEATPVAEEDLQVGLSCLSLFNDGYWYRARIMSITGSSIVVFFVDYGNTDTVQAKSIKDIPRKFVTKFKTIAIHCCLENADQSDQSIRGRLEELINDENVSARVVSEDASSSQLTVLILHNGRDIKEPPSPPTKPAVQAKLANVVRSPEPDESWESPKPEFGVNKKLVSPPWREEQRGREVNQPSRRRNTDNDRNKKWRTNGRSNWRDNDKTENGFQHRSDNDGGFKKRFDREDGGGFKKRFDNEDGGGFKKRFDNEDGGGFKKRFDNEDGGGFKKRFDNEDGGGFKKRFGNEDGGGGGFKKRFDNEDGGGFKKRFNNEDGGGNFNKGDEGSSRPFRVAIRNEDRAPADSTYEEQTIDPGTVKDVTVTFFVSPLEFYVQSYTDQPSFQTMMEKVQTEYVNKFSIRQGTVLQESEIVVAKFYEDRVLYRAEVVTPDPITVRFVDYGNMETVRDSRDVYPVLRELVDLPRQSVKCSLLGVKPKDETWPASVASYFEKSELSCTFVSEENGIHSVSMISEDGDVAAALIAAGLAIPAGDAVVCANGAPAPGATPDLLTPAIDPFDISLLAGQVLLVDIPYVNGVEQFSCHFNPNAVQLMETMIGEYFSDASAKETLDPAEIVPGKLCISCVGDTLYRAKVIEKSDDGVLVKFIDYGDANEVPESDVLRIPKHIEGFRPLSFECGLLGDTSQVTDETQDQFKEEYELKPAIVSIHSVEDESVSVTLYNTDGTKAKLQEGINDSPETVSIPDLPLVVRELNVEIINLINDSALICLPGTNAPDLSSQSFIEPAPEKVANGSPCAVHCQDEVWRRGVRKNETDAYLVDVGETVAVNNFHPLPSDLFAIPAFVRRVKLAWPAIGKLRVKVKKQEDTYTIDPVEKLVYITHVEAANELYIRSSCLEDKQNEIQGIIRKTEPCDLPNAEIISARFPEDESWYRARVEVKEPLCVHFIDYGNKSEVSEVGQLPATLCETPPFAVRVKFEDDLPETAREVFENESLSESPLVVVEENGEIVDFLSSGCSVLAKAHGRLQLTVGDVVHISFVVSPTQFYVQRTTDSTTLEILAEKLVTAESFPTIENDTAEIVAAKFADDEAWYRARIENEQVYFVDHGNYADMLEIRKLPDDLLTIPPLAQKVSLMHPTITEWSDSATEALMEFLDGRPLQVKEVVPCGSFYKVQLADDEVDIASTLENTPTEASIVAPAGDAGDQYSETDFFDQPTDDHKCVALTDDQRAERNETDEQKRGKMEGPRSDDEKGEPCASGIVNMPDSELEQDDVIAVVDGIIDESIARATSQDTENAQQDELETIDGAEGELALSQPNNIVINEVVNAGEDVKDIPFCSLSSDDNNSTIDLTTANNNETSEAVEDGEDISFCSSPNGDNNLTIDLATPNNNETNEVGDAGEDVEDIPLCSSPNDDNDLPIDLATPDNNEISEGVNNEEHEEDLPFFSPRPDDISMTVDLATSNSDNDSGLSSHPLVDLSNSPDAAEVDYEDAVSSPGSADTVPTTEEDQGPVEFISDDITTPIPDVRELKATSDEVKVDSKKTAVVGDKKLLVAKTAICDKIVPGSINRGIDLNNEFSSPEK